MNRIEELAELDHGVELRLRVPAVGVVKEQKPLDVGLHGIEPNLLGDVFTKGSPGPFDGVRVHVRIVRVDEVVRMVDRFVCVVEAHLTQFVVPAPAVAVDDRTALNVVENGFGQRVRTAVFDDHSEHLMSLMADAAKHPPQLAGLDSSHTIFA